MFGKEEEDFQLKGCCCDSHGCDGEDYDGDDDDDSLSEGVKNWSFSPRKEEEITNVVVVYGKVDRRKITLTLSTTTNDAFPHSESLTIDSVQSPLETLVIW